MKYTGQLITGDFEDNTMTFEIDGEMILQAGKYSIEQIQVGNQVKNLGIADVSGCLPDLESVEFFDLMQQYRIAPMENQERVIKAFEAVKEWLRANCH